MNLSELVGEQTNKKKIVGENYNFNFGKMQLNMNTFFVAVWT